MEIIINDRLRYIITTINFQRLITITELLWLGYTYEGRLCLILLITNVDVLTDEGVLKNHAIEIENGYITAILRIVKLLKAKRFC